MPDFFTCSLIKVVVVCMLMSRVVCWCSCVRRSSGTSAAKLGQDSGVLWKKLQLPWMERS